MIPGKAYLLCVMRKSILLAVLSSIFIVFMGMGIIVPVLPLYAAELGATGFALGIIIAVFALSGGVLQPFVGGLSDRHGKKGFLIAGLVIFGLTGYIYTLAGSVCHLVLIRTLHGAGSAMIIPMAMAYITDVSAGGGVGRSMGMLNIAIFAGIGGGPMLGGIFLDLWGPAAAFYAMAGLSFLAAVLVVTLLPRQKKKSGREVRPPMLSMLRRMLSSRRVAGILLSRMATMIIMVPTFAFLPLLMDRHMTASGTAIGIVIASRTLVNAALQMPFGALADRWHKDRLLLIGAAVISVALFTVPFAVSFPALVLLFALIGLGEAICWPALGALAAQEGEIYGQGSMMGVFNAAMNAGLFAGAMVVGILVDRFGIEWAFYAVSLFLLASTAATAVLIRPERRG